MIISQQSEAVLHLIINRPSKKNALTRDMYLQLSDEITRANNDSNIKAIVISGANDVFTAGNDLEDFRSRATDQVQKPSAGLVFIEALMNCDTPVIAGVEGLAIGIGTTLLLHVDVVVTGKSTKFKTAFIDLGLVPEAASTVTMPMHLGSRKATDLLLLGEEINGDQAKEFGLASKVVNDGDAVAAALKIGNHLAGKSREALRASKQLIRAPFRKLLKEALERERVVFSERLRSEDCQAALDTLMDR